MKRLVLWDIDRTLLYVRDVDRRVYVDVFTELVGCPPERLPAKGTGVPVPVAVRDLFVSNGIDADVADLLADRAVELVPQRFAALTDMARGAGVVLPGAVEALRAVSEMNDTVATVVTGNLRPNALAKLDLFGLDAFVDTEVGGYSSDNGHRPALVAVAQARAAARYRAVFTQANTVVIGDSVADVMTGREGGARVIAVASGTTSVEELTGAGADVVLPDLRDTQAVVDVVLRLTSEQVGERIAGSGPRAR